MTEVKVLPVPRGSIVWLHNTTFSGTDAVMDGLRAAVGHTEFVLLCTEGDGIVEVLGPDDLVARVRAALEAE